MKLNPKEKEEVSVEEPPEEEPEVVPEMDKKREDSEETKVKDGSPSPS